MLPFHRNTSYPAIGHEPGVDALQSRRTWLQLRIVGVERIGFDGFRPPASVVVVVEVVVDVVLAVPHAEEGINALIQAPMPERPPCVSTASTA